MQCVLLGWPQSSATLHHVDTGKLSYYATFFFLPHRVIPLRAELSRSCHGAVMELSQSCRRAVAELSRSCRGAVAERGAGHLT